MKGVSDKHGQAGRCFFLYLRHLVVISVRYGWGNLLITTKKSRSNVYSFAFKPLLFCLHFAKTFLQDLCCAILISISRLLRQNLANNYINLDTPNLKKTKSDSNWKPCHLRKCRIAWHLPTQDLVLTFFEMRYLCKSWNKNQYRNYITYKICIFYCFDNDMNHSLILGLIMHNTH